MSQSQADALRGQVHVRTYDCDLVPRMMWKCGSICTGTCPPLPIPSPRNSPPLVEVPNTYYRTPNRIYVHSDDLPFVIQCWSVPYLGRIDVGLCAEHFFSLRPVHLGFVVGRLARRQGFLLILRLSLINVFLTVLVHLSATQHASHLCCTRWDVIS